MIKRVVWIILDSVGIGELPDSQKYGDVGSNTLCNLAGQTKLEIPNLTKLGIGNIDGTYNLQKDESPMGIFGKAVEISDGKDTTIGHWEMVGVYSKTPFPTYPNGFPIEIMTEFEQKVGRGTLANKPASGTDIIEECGEEHRQTGKLIVYTSADSVFQIAANEEVVSLEELYNACQIARDLLKDEHAVARVIARPFVGDKGNYKRTANRRDFSLVPPIETTLDLLSKSGKDVIGIGKIEDIFNGKGITQAIHTKNNMEGVDVTIEYMKQESQGLIFTNLVEFDSAWGHRNDVVGYAKGLMDFDARLPELIAALKEDDLLILNADHGCDPTTPSTDHSREYIPIIAYGKGLKAGVNLGIRNSFADLGQTINEIFGLSKLPIGESFLSLIQK